MKDIYVMAIDLGTSFIKAGIYDLTGTCYGMAQSAVKSSMPVPDVFLQSGEEIYHSVLVCISSAAKYVDADRIQAIGFTGQMAGFMGIGSGWKDLTSWSCSLDTRYAPYAEKMLRDMQMDFLKIGGTGSPLMAPKIQWLLHEYPEQAANVKKYMSISSYVMGRMSGADVEQAVLGRSYITWTGLADIEENKWSSKLCKKAGISVSMLPDIIASNAVCGGLTEEAARQTGLKSGIPLVVGAGDKIAGCIGAGILKDGDMIFEASSYGALSCLEHYYRPNPATWDYDAIPAMKQNQYYLHKYLPGSGISLQWFLDQFAANVPEHEFRQIELLAKELPAGSEGLMACGLLGGSAMPFNSTLRGMWIGHTWTHRREHFFKALLESYVYEIALTIDNIEVMYPELNSEKRIRMIGSGSKSIIWPQILADVTGRSVLLMDRSDHALWGAALMAAGGIGALAGSGSIEDKAEMAALQSVRVCRTVEPNEKNTGVYQELKRIYRDMKRSMQEVCGQLQKSR